LWPRIKEGAIGGTGHADGIDGVGPGGNRQRQGKDRAKVGISSAAGGHAINDCIGQGHQFHALAHIVCIGWRTTIPDNHGIVGQEIREADGIFSIKGIGVKIMQRGIVHAVGFERPDFLPAQPAQAIT